MSVKQNQQQPSSWAGTRQERDPSVKHAHAYTWPVGSDKGEGQYDSIGQGDKTLAWKNTKAHNSSEIRC